MSLRQKFFAANAAVIAINNPATSLEDAANAVKSLFSDSDEFWKEIARQAQRAIRPKNVVATPVAAEPAPAEVEQTTAPANAQPASLELAPVLINVGKTAPAQPGTAPERELKETPADKVAKWVAVLSNFVAGRKKWLDPQKTYETAKWTFVSSGVKLSQDQWQVLFAAMNKIRQTGGHIIHSKCEPEVVFASAPRELVDDFVFGQDGEMVSLLLSLEGIINNVPKHIVARCYIFIAAISALDSTEPGLTDMDLDHVEKIYRRIEAAQGPRDLLEKFEAILFEGEDEPVRPATASFAEVARGLELLNKKKVS